MESDRRPERSKRRTARILGGLIGLFGVGLLAVWSRLISDDAELVIPSPALPHPNAFDSYVAAGKALVNVKQFDNIYSAKPSIRMTPAQKEAVIRQNAAALQLLHQGFTYDYRYPPQRSNFTPNPELSTFRHLAQLSWAQSRVRGAQSDWSGAADSALDAIRLGEDIPRGGTFLAEFTGITCQSIGQHALRDTIDHLNAEQSRGVIIRMTGILARHFPFADTIQEEKWFGQAVLQEMFRTINLHNALSTTDEWTGANTPPMQRYGTALSLLYGRKDLLQSYTAYMDATAAQARRPYAVKLPPPIPNDFLSRDMAMYDDERHFKDAETETQNSLLLVALALQAYRLENGHAPASLAELAPVYLQKLPDDPFALQGAFQYRLKGKSYVLYSVGPDGKDDGGTPIDQPKYSDASSPHRRYMVRMDSVGDIVVGINFP